MYERTNDLVEKLCKIAYVIIVKLSAPGAAKKLKLKPVTKFTSKEKIK